MLKIYGNTIIYVLCPSYKKSGGPELAHQLVYEINQMGGHSEIAYYDLNNEKLQINEAFKGYVSSFVDMNQIIDDSSNVIVSPEAHPEFLDKFKKIQKAIWWMSVDNYLKEHDPLASLKIFGYESGRRILRAIKFSINAQKYFKNVTHFYQSFYARKFLESKGIFDSIRLSDYLNAGYLDLDIETNRENQVVYNPLKGIRFTKMLIKLTPNIKWIPLQNMSTEQVKGTLLHSKVYVDFGNHPGKDRFPREAAMCGCCVITGKRGSAKYCEDVPINDEFKFEENKQSIQLIVCKLRDCFENYETNKLKFDKYRAFIRGEYRIFQEDVKKVFIAR